MDVERATRVAPPPTAELAMTLLDMIKKRCLDGNWDDVAPRSVPEFKHQFMDIRVMNRVLNTRELLY